MRMIGKPLTVIAATAAAMLAGLGAQSAAAAGATKAVRYHGVTVNVPAGWPVIHVGPRSSVCVRFNRHAVYLGSPGLVESCPQQVVGRTEAILVQPQRAADSGVTADARTGALTPTSTTLAAPGDGSMLRIVERAQGVVITATWNHHPQLIRMALDLRSLDAAARSTNGHRPAAATSVLTSRAFRTKFGQRSAHLAAVAPSPATPGEVFTGLGFDACSAPSSASLSAWAGSSPYQAVGVYIGGANMACSQTNLTAAWVSAESAAGWHLVPTYVGLQATAQSCSGCAVISPSQAASEGAAAAQDAVYQAQSLGIGAGNPIYYDMENYAPSASTTATVLTFLNAWTAQLHSSGYLSGVYSSSASGITDLVNAEGSSTFTEPDDIWFAHWGTAANASDSYVPAADWSNNQRLHQYQGSHNETYGGVQMNIDSDYLDGATAAAGGGTDVAAIAAAPSVTVRPLADGAVELTPEWDESGITSWELYGGPSPSQLTAIETISTSQQLPVTVQDNYAYYAVSALNAAGTVLGSSLPIATPASVQIYGKSVFSPASGSLVVPVGCVNTSPCSVQAAIYRGKKRLAHSTTQTISGPGGTIRLPVTTGISEALYGAPERKVTVTVSSGPTVKATRTLELIPFSVSGPTPARKTAANAALRILSKSVLVSNGWVGGVLAVCTATTSCTTTTRVTTRSGKSIATPRTQTLGSGEVGYLTFRLTAAGHALLAADFGNQLPARVAVSAIAQTGTPMPSTATSTTQTTTTQTQTTTTATSAAPTGAVGTAASAANAVALVSLESYR
jgi:hypothetical protein